MSSDGNSGSISLFALGDATHNSFDNTNFLSKNVMLVTEDRGDGLHTQLNALDSIWAYDVSKTSASAKRLVALGRDPASETDSNIGALACLATTPPSCGFTFQNEGDNEPTGIFASDGDSSKGGLLGTKAPDPAGSVCSSPSSTVRTTSGRSSRSSAQRTRNEARVTAPPAVAVIRA